MRKIEQMGFAASALALVALSSSQAFALNVTPDLPAPGSMGLVVGGVIAAIAVARLRSKG